MATSNPRPPHDGRQQQRQEQIGEVPLGGRRNAGLPGEADDETATAYAKGGAASTTGTGIAMMVDEDDFERENRPRPPPPPPPREPQDSPNPNPNGYSPSHSVPRAIFNAGVTGSTERGTSSCLHYKSTTNSFRRTCSTTSVNGAGTGEVVRTEEEVVRTNTTVEKTTQGPGICPKTTNTTTAAGEGGDDVAPPIAISRSHSSSSGTTGAEGESFTSSGTGTGTMSTAKTATATTPPPPTSSSMDPRKTPVRTAVGGGVRNAATPTRGGTPGNRATTTPNHNYANPHTPIASAKRPRGHHTPGTAGAGAGAGVVAAAARSGAPTPTRLPSGRGGAMAVCTPTRPPPPPPASGAATPGGCEFSPMHPPTSGRLQALHREEDEAPLRVDGAPPTDGDDVGAVAEGTGKKEEPSTCAAAAAGGGGGKWGMLFSPVLNFLGGSSSGGGADGDGEDEDVATEVEGGGAGAGGDVECVRREVPVAETDEDGDVKMGEGGSGVDNDDGVMCDGENVGQAPQMATATVSCTSTTTTSSTRIHYEAVEGAGGGGEASSASVTVVRRRSSTTTTEIATAQAEAAAAAERQQEGARGGEDSDSEEEYEDEDEFNPYLFIKHLPPYHSIQSPWSAPGAFSRHHRRGSGGTINGGRLLQIPIQQQHQQRHQHEPYWSIPPKARDAPPITLVLDLDETLVHCTVDEIPDADLTFPVLFGGTEYRVHVKLRPHLSEFLHRVHDRFEVVVFTASQRVYANELLDRIDPRGRFIRHRMFRESCLPVEGNYLKDLNVLGPSRTLDRTVLVDNSPHAFGYQVDNGIPIESWFDDPDDTELLKLERFLRTLHDADDVRTVVRAKFQTHLLVRDA